ncbi:MAG: hypothetical protein L3J35_07610 [Bacteroidales bacterium]|nr:hypothetical protein [Bacteroidales bacterium]
MKKLIFILFLSFSFSIVFSQGEVDTEHKILFRNEKSFAFVLNSNGYGLGYRYGKRINVHKKFLYEGDFNIVKHNKEKKISNPLTYNIFNFVYGKTNVAFNLRFAVGRHHEIFKKFDRNSVSVRWFYVGGISAMFLKPIYYDVWSDSINATTVQLFTENTPWWFIHGKKSFSYGFNEIKVIPGIYAKTGFSFEFSKTDKKLSMLETGISFEAYPKPIKIMETENNPMFFPTIYLAYRFGKVESGYYLKEQDEGTK